MSAKRNALGRGIDALLPRAPVADSASASTASAVPGESALRVERSDAPPDAGEALQAGFAELPIDQIDPNPEQPRRHFDPDALEQLARSIQQHGVLQPVVVRRSGERFELLVGERRWRASRAAGLRVLPAVISDSAERERLELALVENVQRRDLNPIELAIAFRTLADAGATQEEIGRRVGLDRSTVANHIRLLELSRSIQEDVESTRLTGGHAKALLQIGNPERRLQLRDRILKDGLSVRAAEDLARDLGSASPKARARSSRRETDPNLQRLVDALRQRLQTRVRIQGGGERGRIEIEYFGQEDLNRLTNLVLGDA